MEDYITVDKNNKVFQATCSLWGTIELGNYKMWEHNNCCGDTFALNYFEAVDRLHSFIKDRKEILENEPKCHFEIYMADGSVDKYNELVFKRVYKITAKFAKDNL